MTERQGHRTALGFGVLLLVAGVLMPASWYHPLPQRIALPPPPMSGFLLLRISLAVEGLALIWLGRRRWTFVRVTRQNRLALSPVDEAPDPRGVYLRWVAVVTLLGLGLRLIAINSDLWIDEITLLHDYGNASMWQAVTSNISSNNHLLNTLLVKLCVSMFGQHEWAIRLPAVVFGTATIPALYGVARQVLTRRASLSAAVLLAVSYHHIFFSQNARGYTAYVFFSLVSSALLVRGLQEDRAGIWAAYVLMMTLNFASMLIAAFVFAAHVLVGGLTCVWIGRRGRPALPLLQRLAGVFAVTAFLGFQVYAAVLPQMYAYLRPVYADPAVGFAPLSSEFVAEVARGLATGFGPGLLLGAIPLLAIAGVGFAVMLRRNWPLIGSLTAPAVFQAGARLAGGLLWSPRFFILMLPVTLLVAVQGIEQVVAFTARLLRRSSGFAWATNGVVAVLVLMFAASLPHYYAVPKQAFRPSLRYVESLRGPDDIVIVVHLAESGYRYYGGQFGIREGTDYFYVRSVATLDHVLSEHPARRSWVVVTFPRNLRLTLPDLDARIKRDWMIIQTFPGTVGDGDVTVWQQRRATVSANLPRP